MLNFVFGILLAAGLNAAPDTTSTAKEIPYFSVLAEHHTLTIHADYTYTRVVESRLIVTSPDGIDHATTRLFYDKLNEVRDFELEMKDPSTGKTLKKARLKDMGDAAYYSTSTVFDDNRYKYFEVTSAKYPIEIKIRSEVFSKSNFNIPSWSPVPSYNQKVTETSYTVHYPTALGLKYKELNLSGDRVEDEAAGITTITWKEKDLAVQAKDFDTEEDPRLLLAPVSFSLDQYRGEMKDWAGFASWQYELNKGRDALPADFTAKILNLVDGVDEPYERVKILYSYLQKNFRYVSIQLGIGGWQTMTAADVVKYAYGDCKGLTNLMKAMLEVAGIPSNYTLVYAGSNADDIEMDLPSNQFNHVILQVPTDADPIWLECTSSMLPAGFLGDFTRNRHVLVTKKEGGYLTKTPSYESEEWNLIQSQSKVVIDAQGNAKISSKQQFFGNFAEEILYVKNTLDERQQRDYLNRNSAVSGLIVQGYQIEIVSQDSLLNAELSFDGVVQRFSQTTAKRVILKSFIGKLGPDHLANKSLKQKDDYEIELPEDWKPDGEFPKVTLDEEHATGSLHITHEGKILRVRRELHLRIPEDFAKANETELLRKINTVFDRTILLTKSTLATVSK
ncbi:hypothetical protein GCM10009119_05550 [Algoriphagus jejuensis]|uniref:Transglutaminase superfamily protein n=1 Tax=Algoriphagus jejuensis TaxID=419934 RepID=A0ABP3Y9R9_9BACT